VKGSCWPFAAVTSTFWADWKEQFVPPNPDWLSCISISLIGRNLPKLLMFDFLVRISSSLSLAVDTPGSSRAELLRLMQLLAGVISLLDYCGSSKVMLSLWVTSSRMLTLSLTVSCLLMLSLPLWDCLRLLLLLFPSFTCRFCGNAVGFSVLPGDTASDNVLRPQSTFWLLLAGLALSFESTVLLMIFKILRWCREWFLHHQSAVLRSSVACSLHVRMDVDCHGWCTNRFHRFSS